MINIKYITSKFRQEKANKFEKKKLKIRINVKKSATVLHTTA